MIEKTQSYKTPDGQIFCTIELAQRHELIALMAKTDISHADSGVKEVLAECLVAQKAEVMDILSTGPRSHVKARKANGATRKPRVALAQIQPAGEKK